MTVEWPGLGASASYGSIEAATGMCVCACVCALHGYRAPRVIWSTSLRRSGLVGRRNWQFHALLFLPQTSTLKTPQTRHHLYISHIDEVTITARKPPFCAGVFVPKVPRQMPCFVLQTRQTQKRVLVLKVCNSRLNTKRYGWAVGSYTLNSEFPASTSTWRGVPIFLYHPSASLGKWKNTTIYYASLNADNKYGRNSPTARNMQKQANQKGSPKRNINLLEPNDIYIYIYIYIYISYRSANLQTLHFKYLFNKYTYWIF